MTENAGPAKALHSTVVALEESIRSQDCPVQKPTLSLSIPPILPKSWYATQDIAWAPEDHDTYAWAILEQKFVEEVLMISLININASGQTLITLSLFVFFLIIYFSTEKVCFD